jgi:hypothetical protein
MFLIMSLAFLGCANGTTNTSGNNEEFPYGPSDPSGPGGSRPEPTQPVAAGTFAVDSSDTTMNPAGLTATAVKGTISGNITVTLRSNADIPIGLPSAVAPLFKPWEFFDPVEMASQEYFAFTLEGLIGGLNTRIKQINGALGLHKESGYVTNEPSPWINGEIYKNSSGVFARQKDYGNLAPTFDLSILIAKGKGPVTLVITPDTTVISPQPYTVTINYTNVTFSKAGVALVSSENYVAPATATLPTGGSHAVTTGNQYNHYGPGGSVELDIEVTQQAGTNNYIATVDSGGAVIGGGIAALPGDDTSLPGTPPYHPYEDMSVATAWTGTYASSVSAIVPKLNVITLNFYNGGSNNGIFANHDGSSLITIKQVNPAFKP